MPVCTILVEKSSVLLALRIKGQGLLNHSSWKAKKKIPEKKETERQSHTLCV